MRNLWVSFFFVFCLTVQSKTLVINIGFECKDCSLGTLKGVPADLKFYDELSKSLNADRLITIDEKKWGEVGGKSSVLEHIKRISKNYDTVIFQYSGHGLPVPLSANAINKTNDPQFKTSDFELGLIGQDFFNCFKGIKFEDKCADPCMDAEGVKPGCNLELVKKNSLCSQKCSNEYQKMKEHNEKLDFTYARKCITQKCRFITKEMEEICKQNDDNIVLCKKKCEEKSNRNNYSQLSDRFTNTQVNECITKNVILRSDIEKIFAGKKFYGFIDSCYSGLMLDMRHDNAIIASAASALQLAKNIGARGGAFTLAKKLQLEESLCKESLTLDEFYLSHTKLNEQTPESRKIGGQNGSGLKLTLSGLKCSNTSTPNQSSGVPTSEGIAK